MGYPKEVYEKAWDILDSRRETARKNLEYNRQEARERIPEFEEIERQMAITGAAVSRSIIANPADASKKIEELAEINLSLQSKRTQLLENAGYSDNFLKESFTCEKCSDTGYIGMEMCSCFAQLLKQEAFKALNLSPQGSEGSFESFSLDFYSSTPDGKTGVSPRQRMSEIYDYCLYYAENFSLDSESLLFMGKTGLGKTHLSLAIARVITKNGFGVVYTPVQRLMDKLEMQKFSYSTEAKEAYSRTIGSILECDLLVLDDLGTEFQSSFSTSTLYNIVNTRMVEGRPTIINTNLDPAGLEQTYSQRMASRLGFSYKILRFFGDDIRFLRRMQK